MDESIYRIAVSWCEGIGPKTYHSLARKIAAKGLTFGDLFALDVKDLALEFALAQPVVAKILEARRGLDAIADMCGRMSEQGVVILVAGMPGYPDKCSAWMGEDAPPLLYAMGPLALTEQKGVAVVGARAAGEEALRAAVAIARQAADDGAVVVSGYAPGVDSHAHLGAMAQGGGTIACLPDGIEHFRLRRELRDAFEPGSILVLSQHSPHQPWSSQCAMARNATICALADAVIVVEAHLRGGSMHAAETARAMGKPVFAVELEPLPDGNGELIRTGAPALRVSDTVDLSDVLAAEPSLSKSEQPGLF